MIHYQRGMAFVYFMSWNITYNVPGDVTEGYEKKWRRGGEKKRRDNNILTAHCVVIFMSLVSIMERMKIFMISIIMMAMFV